MENKKLEIIIDACESKKANDIKVLEIGSFSSISDYFVIVSGNSSTQVDAISDEIEFKMEEEGYELLNAEGKNSMRWIVLDYGDIVVHVFHKDERKYYNLERLWEKDDETKEKSKGE
ncbi:Ribosomal silencing factor RsfS [Peptoniphilus sp. ING2-D1G]|nr:Ribosomal silencing factor RsfS [Peptoniphilus sp. ING2-D1G]